MSGENHQTGANAMNFHFEAGLRPLRFSISIGGPSAGEVGFNSISKYDTLAPGEYNPRLMGAQAIKMYDRMRRSDGQVSALEAMISLPIRAVPWYVEPAGNGSADLEAAELIETNLMRTMSVTWDDFLRQQLTAPMIGFACQEQVWVEEGGYIRWAKFVDRLQTTVENFIYDDNGDLAGIMQAGTDTEGRYRRESIPIEKLLVTTYRKEGGNAAGFPILRPAYPHYWIKTNLYRLVNIGLEQNMAGRLMAKFPRGSTQVDRDAMLEVLNKVRVHDKGVFLYPEGWEPGVLEGKTGAADAMPMIDHHDIMIARAGLAQFLNLGSTSVGARSLGEEQAKMFLVGEQTLADGMAENLNRNVIPQLCQWNFPGMKGYPRLKHFHLRSVLRLEAIGETLTHLAQGQLLTPDRDIEKHIRDMWELPEMPKEQPAPAPSGPGGSSPSDETQPPDPNAPADAQPPAGDQRSPRPPRRGTAHVRHDHLDAHAFAEPDVSAIGTIFEQTADAFQTKAGDLISAMIERLARTARPLLDKLSQDQPLSRGKVYPILAALEIPQRAAYLTLIREYLWTLIQAGRQVAADMTGSASPAVPNELRSYVNAQADLLVEKHLADLKFAFTQQVLDGAAGTITVDQMVNDARQAARAKVNTDFAGSFRLSLLSLVNELPSALGIGPGAAPSSPSAPAEP
jgi:hypothetical protein